MERLGDVNTYLSKGFKGNWSEICAFRMGRRRLERQGMEDGIEGGYSSIAHPFFNMKGADSGSGDIKGPARCYEKP